MSDPSCCPVCGDWPRMDRHVCLPAWDVVIEGYHEECDPARVHARDAREAAERAVDRRETDSIERPIASGREDATVLVRPAAGDGEPGPWRRFEVRGEMVGMYYAREVQGG